MLCGCLISLIGFGPRSALGFFLTPLSQAHGWGREVFALSVAVQTLLYGAAQPFSGAIADRFGTVRVIIAGTLLYAAGLFMMAHAATPRMLYLSSGVLIGFGLSGCSFNLVISSFGKLLPESWRSLAFGAGTAGLVRPVPVLAARGEPDRRVPGGSTRSRFSPPSAADDPARLCDFHPALRRTADKCTQSAGMTLLR